MLGYAAPKDGVSEKISKPSCKSSSADQQPSHQSHQKRTQSCEETRAGTAGIRKR